MKRIKILRRVRNEELTAKLKVCMLSWVFLATSVLGLLVVGPGEVGAEDYDMSHVVGMWTFDEGSGDTVKDYSGNGNHGTRYGPVWVDGKNCSGLYHDGEDDYVEVPDDDSLDFGENEDFTLEAWFITDQIPSTDFVIISRYNPSNSDNIALAIDGNGTVYFHIRQSAGGSKSSYVWSKNSYNDGNWHHVAGIRDASSDILKLYVDGEEAVSPANEKSGSGGFSQNRFYIGRGGASNVHHFNGTIDEVVIHNTSLEPSEFYGLKVGYPDLRVVEDSIEFSEEPEVGETVTINATIENIGNTYMENHNIMVNNTTIESTCRFSPDGKKITFTDDEVIYVMNADGTGLTSLDNTSSGQYTHYPVWLFDNRRIMYSKVISEGSDADFYVVDSITGAEEAWDNSLGGEYIYLDISDDGKKVVYARQAGSNGASYEIYLQNLDETDRIQLTDDSGNEKADRAPTFSHDGNSIYWIRSDSGAGDPHHIWRMNLDGSDKEKITTSGDYGHPLTITPDDLWIIAGEETDEDLKMVNTETGEVEFIFGDDVINDRRPDLSPDGTKLTFLKGSSGSYELWQLNATATANVSFYDGNPDDGGILIGTDDIAVWANATAKVQVEWTPMIGGEHEIYVVVYDVYPGDGNESNNVAMKIIEVVDNGIWQRMDDEPSNRSGFTNGAYDPTNNMFVMFGGAISGSDQSNETWLFNVNSNIWIQKFPAFHPSKRWAHGMVYDPMNEKVIMFGGHNGSTHFNDTWIYDVKLNQWNEMKPNSAPSARRGFGMTFDMDNNIVILFGGYDGNSRNDTWYYCYENNTWWEIVTTGSPSPRYYHLLSYDENSKKVVLFGGDIGSGIRVHDTWIYDSTSEVWEEKNPEIYPSGRDGYGFTYQSSQKKVILFGGHKAGGAYDDETWEYDLINDTWIRRNPQYKPSIRTGMMVAYDSLNGKVILFAGYDGSTRFNDIWLYDYEDNNWTQRGQLEKPALGDVRDLTYGMKNEIFLGFGGYNGNAFFNNTWQYNARTNIWKQLYPQSAPSKRTTTVVYDEKHELFILFGGYNNGYFNDTWVYYPGNNTWEQMCPENHPSKRSSHSLAYDSKNGVIVLFGGINGSNYYNDTWIYDFEKDTWVQQDHSKKPAGRGGHKMIYDPIHQKMIMFSGTIKLHNQIEDLWAYDVSADEWELMDPATSPSKRHSYTLVYHNDLKSIVLYGGRCEDGDDTYFDDFWSYDYGTDSWTLLIEKNPPGTRAYHGMDYDVANNLLILRGGNNENHIDDTWGYHSPIWKSPQLSLSTDYSTYNPGDTLTATATYTGNQTDIEFEVEYPNGTTMLTKTAPTSTAQSPNDEGLVAYWTFDENEGDTANDKTGNNNDGSIHGATLTKGISGIALEFDGADDRVVIDPSDELMNIPTGAYTLEAWIKADTIHEIPKFILDADSDDQNGLRIYQYKPVFKWVTTDGSYYVNGSDSLNPNQWYHFTGVFDGNSTGLLYVDGKLASSGMSTGDSLAWERGPTIGDISRGGTGDGFFDGIIDEVTIWSRALNEQEISRLYESNVNNLIRVCPINIDNSLDVSLTSYQVKIEITDSEILGNINTNGSNLRFYDDKTMEPYADPYTGLPFWIENSSASKLTVWVKRDIPAESESTIYMYYGKPSAVAVGCGDDVFGFFDDFNGDNMDMEKWEQVNYNSNYDVDISEGTVIMDCWKTDGNVYFLTKNNEVPRNAVAEGKFRPIQYGGDAASGEHIASLQIIESNENNEHPIVEFSHLANFYSESPDRTPQGEWVEIDDQFTRINSSLEKNTWHRAAMVVTQNGDDKNVTIYSDSDQLISGSKEGNGSDPSKLAFGVGQTTGNEHETAEWDWIFVRNYASTEPTVTIGTPTSFYDQFGYSTATLTFTLPTDAPTGTYTIHANTTDASTTTTFEVVLPPQAIIDFISPNPSLLDEDVRFNGRGIYYQNISRYVWTSDINGEIHNGISANFTLNNLSRGFHTIRFKVLTESGIWSEEDISYLNVTEQPVAHVEDGYPSPDPALDTDMIEFRGNGTDDGLIEVCQWVSDINGTIHEGTTGNFSTDSLMTGMHNLIFRVQDNHGFWSDNITLTLNVTGRPTAVIESISPNPALNDTEITFTGGGTDDGSIVRYSWSSSIDGTLYNGTESTFVNSTLSTGFNHTITLKVQDDLGYWSDEVTSYVIVTERPVAHIEDGYPNPNPATDTDTVEFKGGGTDDFKISLCVWISDINGTIHEGTTGNFTTDNLMTGMHNLTFRVQDNNGFWSDNITLTLNVTGRPTAIIDTISPNPALNDTEVAFKGNGTDDGSIVRYSWSSDLYGEFYNGTNTTVISSILPIGYHTISLTVQDNLGFWSDPSFSYLNITTRPVAHIEAGYPSPNPARDDQTVEFVAWGIDDNVIVLCQWTSDINGTIHTGSDGNFTTEYLIIGHHNLTFRVQDNHGFWSAEIELTIDVTGPPTAIIDSIIPNPVLVGSNVTFKGNGTDDGSIIRYVWSSDKDGILYNGTNSSFTSSDITRNSHVITLKVQDDLGFWSQEVTDELIVVGRPGAIIDKIMPAVVVEGNNIAFYYNGTADGSIIRYVWNSNISGEIYNGTNNHFKRSDLAVGIHNLSFRVMDVFGFWSMYEYSTVTITPRVNHAPVINSVSIKSSDDPYAYETSEITAVFDVFDPDGDSLYNHYIWHVNDEPIGLDYITLNGSYFKKGDTVYLTLSVSDGKDSTEADTGFMVISNLPPTIDDIKILPENPKSDHDLIVQYTFHDPDGDVENGTLIRWYMNNGSGMKDTRITGDTVHMDYIFNGQEWRCTIVPSDGDDSGPSYNSEIVSVTNVKPVLIISSPRSDQDYKEGEKIFFDASESYDPDGNNLEYRWNISGLIKRTANFSEEFSPGTYILNLTISDGEYSVSKEITFKVKEDQGIIDIIIDPLPTMTPSATIMVFAGTGFFAIALKSTFNETWKFWLFSLFIVLYTRMKPDEADNSETRGEILGYLRKNPGAHYNMIKEDLGFGNNQLTHHLDMLIRMKRVRHTKDKRYKRFFLHGDRIPETKKVHQEILEILEDFPGMKQKKVAKYLRMNPRTAAEYLKELEQNGHIRCEESGREKKYYLVKPGVIYKQPVSHGVDSYMPPGTR